MATLLTNLRLWDGPADTVLDGAAVVIEGDRIAWAGPAAEAPISASAVETVDCRGGTLIPGLIDAHIHLAMRRPPGAGPLALALYNAGEALGIGITAARDLGAPDHSVITAARMIELGEAPGPFVIAAGRPVALPGGYVHGAAVEADTPEAVRAAVAAQVVAGAGVIKVIASPVPPNPEAKVPRSFGYENLAAAVEVAHAAGLRITAHAHSLAGALDAVHAGVDCIEHGYRLNAEGVAEMAQRGVWFVPTMVAMEAAQTGWSWDRAETLPPFPLPHTAIALGSRAHERWEAAVDAVRKAHRAGVRIAAGTDAVSIVPIGAIRREVALLVEAGGLTPLEALRAATSDAAELLGIAAETGAIIPGRRADLLLVDGDPLADPAVLTRVRGVWRAGVRAAG